MEARPPVSGIIISVRLICSESCRKAMGVLVTSYSTSFMLTGEEVPIYRAMLQSWLLATQGELTRCENSGAPSFAPKNTLEFIEALIGRTYDGHGRDALEVVEKSLSFGRMFPFWKIVDEVERTEANVVEEESRKDNVGPKFNMRLKLIQRVANKVKHIRMASTSSFVGQAKGAEAIEWPDQES